MIFTKDTKFKVDKEFNSQFPMFKKCKIVLNPFVIINTNGACVLFKTPDSSHFIYTTANNTCYLMGASKELLENNSVPWVMKNILNISVSYTRITTKSCEFNYEGKRYTLIIKDCHRNVAIYLSVNE